LHADKALGAQHKAFLLIRRLPLFEQVRVMGIVRVSVRVIVIRIGIVIVTGSFFLLVRRLPLFEQVRVMVRVE